MTPLWVRLWHWAIAVLFVILVVTGVILTYSTSDFALMNYALADTLHQVTGIMFAILFAAFLVAAGVSGHWRRYQRQWQGLWSRIRIHGANVVNGNEKAGDSGSIAPPRIERTRGFLILVQQLLSIFSIVVLSPLLVITGLVLLYPEWAPAEVAGLGGIWPLALAHYVVGLIGALFLLFHAYIATINGLRRMIRGR